MSRPYAGDQLCFVGVAGRHWTCLDAGIPPHALLLMTFLWGGKGERFFWLWGGLGALESPIYAICLSSRLGDNGWVGRLTANLSCLCKRAMTSMHARRFLVC